MSEVNNITAIKELFQIGYYCVKVELKAHRPAENNKISLILYPCLCRQMPLNIQLNWIKRFYRAKQK